MCDRDFLFGLHRVKAWNYWWGYSAAQIELIAIDAPLVLYKPEKGKFGKVDRTRAREVTEKWVSKYKDNGGETINLTDILGGKKWHN